MGPKNTPTRRGKPMGHLAKQIDAVIKLHMIHGIPWEDLGKWSPEVYDYLSEELGVLPRRISRDGSAGAAPASDPPRP